MSEGRARSAASFVSQSSGYTAESTVLNQEPELFAQEGLQAPYPTKVTMFIVIRICQYGYQKNISLHVIVENETDITMGFFSDECFD